MFVLLLAVILMPMNLYADSSAGRFTHIDGKVNIQRPGAGKLIPVDRGDEISIGDTVVTGAGSHAHVAFVDKSFVYMAPNSRLMVTHYSLTKIYTGDERRKAVLNLMEGKIRAIAKGYAVWDSDFIVETPTTSASAREADFVIAATPSETNVAVLNGRVTVKNISSFIVGEMFLRQNQSSAVKKNLPPAQPVTLTLEQRIGHIKEIMGHGIDRTQKGVK